jgi:hypothetical protein
MFGRIIGSRREIMILNVEKTRGTCAFPVFYEKKLLLSED